MAQPHALEARALSTLLQETLLRADREFAYLLNPGDPGLVATLQPLSHETASRSPGLGRKPIVSHANHVLYGIELANRAFAGERGVYENADWQLAWKLETVSEQQWRDLVNHLKQQSERLIEQLSQPREWNEIMLTGAFSIPAHTAYHLGAIRQILFDLADA